MPDTALGAENMARNEGKALLTQNLYSSMREKQQTTIKKKKRYVRF